MADKKPPGANEDMYGLEAFRRALAPQEGAFMRGASVIMNAPKDLGWKPSKSPNPSTPKKPSDNERLADVLMRRNPLGQFAKKTDLKDGGD